MSSLRSPSLPIVFVVALVVAALVVFCACAFTGTPPYTPAHETWADTSGTVVPITESNVKEELDVLKAWMATKTPQCPASGTSSASPPTNTIQESEMCQTIDSVSGSPFLGATRTTVETCLLKALPLAIQYGCATMKSTATHNDAAQMAS